MKVEVNADNYKRAIAVSDDITEKLRAIGRDTGMMSTHNHIYEHPKFVELCEMGDKIVPYLIHRITHYGGSWIIFCLLNRLTKVNPVPNEFNGSFIQHIIYWLQWYTTSEYKETDNIYHGLI